MDFDEVLGKVLDKTHVERKSLPPRLERRLRVAASFQCHAEIELRLCQVAAIKGKARIFRRQRVQQLNGAAEIFGGERPLLALHMEHAQVVVTHG